MELFEFNQLVLDEQSQIIWEHGNYLLSREEQEYKIDLYSIFGFYSEIWFSKEQNSLETVINFEVGGEMDIYLSQIDLKL